jgi:glycosyltransferase involved in cell wall biosynthesis
MMAQEAVHTNGRSTFSSPAIMMVVSLFHPHLGGAEQQALMLAEQLIKKGMKVAVLTRTFKGLPSFEVIRGVPVYRCIRTLPRGKWFGLSYMVSALWFLFRNRNSYDIIHCHLLGFHSAVAVLLKWLFGKKTISLVGATGPVSDFLQMKNIFMGNFFLRLIARSDRLILLCSKSREEALAEGFSPAQLVYIPNGVDTACFKPGPDIGKQGNTITFIGRLDYLKGVDILLQAFSRLINAGIPARLDILGDGPERNNLEMMSQQLGINDAVAFHGAVHGVAPYLQQAAMLVLPSLSEGMPNVVLEAMACGLPVVATRVGGIVDIIADGENGLLVDAQRPDQLYEAMKRLFTDRQLADRLGRQALKTIEQQFSLAAIVNRYTALYQALMKSS